MTGTRFVVVSLALAALVLSACEGASRGPATPIETDELDRIRDESGGKLFGDIELFGPEDDEPQNAGIGVNGFLWRASLDTVSFLPLSSADPFGGVIITDWYAPPETPDERFKATVFILGRELRSDGIQVSLFRQTRGEDGGWRDAVVSEDTATRLENAILTRARELRIASLQQ